MPNNLPKGKLIAMESIDGAGKATQARLLYDALSAAGYRAKKISFPDYESDSSALIKMYLSGQLGSSPGDVNAYAASLFYAADRYASFKRDWQKHYNAGELIISDRYSPSNMAHQAVKIENAIERAKFAAWLDDLEYEKLGLPRPDMVIFLDMPPSIAARLVKERGKVEDIHEKNAAYTEKVYAAYKELAEKYSWEKIPCAQGGETRPIADIQADVLCAARKIL